MPEADLRPCSSMQTQFTHNRNTEKTSCQAAQFNIWTIWSVDKTSAQPCCAVILWNSSLWNEDKMLDEESRSESQTRSSSLLEQRFRGLTRAKKIFGHLSKITKTTFLIVLILILLQKSSQRLVNSLVIEKHWIPNKFSAIFKEYSPVTTEAVAMIVMSHMVITCSSTKMINLKNWLNGTVKVQHTRQILQENSSQELKNRSYIMYTELIHVRALKILRKWWKKK